MSNLFLPVKGDEYINIGTGSRWIVDTVDDNMSDKEIEWTVYVTLFVVSQLKDVTWWFLREFQDNHVPAWLKSVQDGVDRGRKRRGERPPR